MKETILVVLIAVILLTSGCVMPASGGILQVRITDQANEISSLIVTINEIKVHKAGDENLASSSEGQETNETETGEWITVVGTKVIDLIRVKGIEEILGEATLAEGRYTQVRLSVSSAAVTIDDSSYSLTIPSKSIKFIHPFEIKANETTVLLIDFDADRSTVKAGDKYILKPVVRISAENPEMNLEETCTSSGGTVKTQLCCKSVNDFPNTCLIGACGCSPDNSKEVKVCDCGADKCWDSNKNACTAIGA